MFVSTFENVKIVQTLTRAGKQETRFFSVLKIIQGQVSQNYLPAMYPCRSGPQGGYLTEEYVTQ